MVEETYEPGDACPESGCPGKLQEADPVNCSCHIAPPCSACTDAGYECGTCGWESNHERHEFEFTPMAPQVQKDRTDETTWTRTDNAFNSTPFTRCCGTAAINTERCPNCNARITFHEDGLAERRRQVGPGSCLMCGKPVGPLEISGNCCC